MKRWLLPLSLSLACDGGAAPEADVQPAPAATSQAAQEQPGQGKSETPVVDSPAEAVLEEWLVWFDAGSGLRSRWYTTRASGTQVTAKRSALVLADGDTLWHVRRKDASADVFACECFESESQADCKKAGSLRTLGLEAEPMDGGPVLAVETAQTERIYGEVDSQTLTLNGGVGARLMVSTTDAGYYCGAHGFYAGVTHLHDVSSPQRPVWPEVKLPSVMMKEAALWENMMKDYKECWDEPGITMDAFVDDIMKIVAVQMSLDAGMVRLRWHAEADGPYVCTGDYAFDGYVKTTLLPPAAELGLAPPVPKGLAAALKDVGTAEVVGWSKLERTGAARAEALAWFRALDETPWAPSSTEQGRAPNPTPAEADKGARGLLAQGRKLTKAKDYAGADTALSKAITLEPEAARPYAARCYARLLAEKLQAARKDCDKALALRSEGRFAASVHYNLGQISVRTGDTQKAREAYEASLALRDSETVRHALESL
ncbi:MAG: tetratricopeptide repeat protein [Nannocystaceae bacterium]|nr:tetratricopeptide repeat protein [Nannocystaceae bacterium]